MRGIAEIKIPSFNGDDCKHIKFKHEDKVNISQFKYINTLFNPDLTLREDNNYEDFAYFGAFRCGKSMIQQFTVFLFCWKYPNLKAVYIRDTYDQLKDTVIKQFLIEFEHLGWFTYKKSERAAYFKNGSYINFRAFDRDTNILSAEYDLIAMCQAEDLPEELFLQALGRGSGRILPRSLLLTEGNPASGWVKKRYKDATLEERENRRIYFIEGKTGDNPFITQSYIDKLIRNYPENWLSRYLYGNWENIDEMVFSEFRENKHIIDPIDYDYIKTYKQRIGMDYGWKNPTALVWGAIDYDGCLNIFDEWGGSEKTPQEILEASIKYDDRHGKRLITVADYSIKRPEKDGRSLWDDLRGKGMMLKESNKQELQNIVLINTLLKTGRLKISKNCIELIKEIKNYKWKKVKLGEQKNFSETPVQKDNHYIDALLYLSSSLEELKTPNPEDIKFKGSLKYRTSHAHFKRDINIYS